MLQEARKLANREGLTLKALVEQGLRRVIAERERGTGFRLRDASFMGDGLQPDVQDATWERLRELTYEGRGG